MVEEWSRALMLFGSGACQTYVDGILAWCCSLRYACDVFSGDESMRFGEVVYLRKCDPCGLMMCR